MLGGRKLQGDPLVGTLVDVHKAAKGSDLVAIFAITGRAVVSAPGTETAFSGINLAVNAQMVFTFAPPAVPEAPLVGENAPANATGIVEARGAITELRLARSSTSALPGTSSRFRRTLTREITIQPRWRRRARRWGFPLPHRCQPSRTRG